MGYRKKYIYLYIADYNRTNYNRTNTMFPTVIFIEDIDGVIPVRNLTI